MVHSLAVRTCTCLLASRPYISHVTIVIHVPFMAWYVYICICTLDEWKFKGTACGYITHVLHRETFCACTAQRNFRTAWRLQNRIRVSVKIKLQAITCTSGNDNNILVHSYHTENVKTV